MSPKQRAFLKAFAVSGRVSPACRAAKIGRRTHYGWMDDPEYAAAFEDARQEAADHWEEVAEQIAKGEFQRPLMSRGVPQLDPAGQPLMVSDPPNPIMVMFILKGLRPEKYRENSKVDHNFPGGALTVQVEFVKPS